MNKDNIFDKLNKVQNATKPVPPEYAADEQFMKFMRRMMTVILLGIAMMCYTAYSIAKLFVPHQ